MMKQAATRRRSSCSKARQQSKSAIGCHEYGEEHANFERSQHNINDVSCIACHSTHHGKEKQFLLVNKQPELCYGCHTDIKQDFNRPFRHRVEQRPIQCTDCHNQHGGFLTKQLRATAAQDQVCFKCHTDKVVPVFEHVPVKTDGCASCHQPHGSTNPRLLKRTDQLTVPGVSYDHAGHLKIGGSMRPRSRSRIALQLASIVCLSPPFCRFHKQQAHQRKA
jgi:DmsE family decaheme c-type cytochrome